MKYLVVYAKASEKPFTTEQIENDIIEVDFDTDLMNFEYIDKIKRELTYGIVIISISKLD